MTDFELRIKAINLATDELRAQPAQYMSATQVGSYTRPAFDVQKRAEKIYEWLKEAEPSKSSVGNYTLFFDNGELRIAKEGVDLSVGVDLDDLWDDLHQSAAEPVGKGVASFSEPAESPAEQPAKRVAQIGDVIIWHGEEFLVYVVFDDSKNFRAIKCASLSGTTFYFDRHMEGKEGGWTFKD